MKKLLLFTLCILWVAPLAYAGEKAATKSNKPATVATSTAKDDFKARRKQIKELIKKYKKASESEKPAIKAELSRVVGAQVDAQMAYMKARIADERANLDNWEKKIKVDEQNLQAVKDKRVEDLLSGEAQKKQKAAKKAWKKQMHNVK